jgi:dihydrofolate reductase
MTRTVYATATTLDGFLADEQDSLEWLFVQDHDPQGPGGHDAFMAGVGSMVMGATTYLWVLDHMAGSGEPWSYRQPCWVLTHRDLPVPEGADVRFDAADDAAAVRRVHAALVEAADGGDVWVVGGGALAADLAAEGLLDELRLSIAPVTLGAGKPLLPRPFDLRLTDLDRNGAFAVATYEVVGPLSEKLRK